jgi:hypothetical protein
VATNPKSDIEETDTNKQTASTSMTKQKSMPGGKRWSEIKSWQKINAATKRGKCLSNINKLVKDAKKSASKCLRGRYLAIVK